MADFVAVLKKTIDNLSENTPEMREKVYDKARATIDAKIAALNPPPPQMVVERQKKALEDAIVAVRASYDDSVDEQDDLDSVMASLGEDPDTAPAEPASPPPAVDHDAERPLAGDPVLDPAADDQGPATVGPETEGLDEPEVDEREQPAADRAVARSGSRRRSGAALITALVLLVVFAGGGYALWLNKDDFAGLLGRSASVEEPVTEAPAEIAVEEAADEPAGEAEVAEADAPPEEEVAALADAPEEPASEEASAPADATSSEPEKFTQRLLPDGTEVDSGPADAESSIGEGTSVASAASSPQSGDDAGEGETASAEGGPADDEAEETPGVAVGQRAIFYEERTTTAQGSAETGSIVWSLVQESPGADLPPEPAIRAEATIPGKDLQLRMTIRRNGDESLPASHIIEMIFLTPDDFQGGDIENVTRVTFKESEQAAGNPLLGIPAKIADGFFLLALSDTPADIETNTTLMRRQSWIDIPLVYQSGRRALFSLEKGVPGDRVFQEAMRAWAEPEPEPVAE